MPWAKRKLYRISKTRSHDPGQAALWPYLADQECLFVLTTAKRRANKYGTVRSNNKLKAFRCICPAHSEWLRKQLLDNMVIEHHDPWFLYSPLEGDNVLFEEVK